MRTMTEMLEPASSLFMLIFLIFYMFGLWGMYMFGGVIKKDSIYITVNDGIPSDFYLMNFNDVTSSLITLYALMIVNNWYVIVNMIVMFMGSTLYRYYFILFYYVAVIIAVNILMAFAIDIYAVIEKIDNVQQQNRTVIFDILMSRHGQHSAFA